MESETLQFISTETKGRYFGEVETKELVQFLREDTLKQTLVKSGELGQRQRDDGSWIFMILASIGLFGFILLDSGIKLK